MRKTLSSIVVIFLAISIPTTTTMAGSAKKELLDRLSSIYSFDTAHRLTPAHLDVAEEYAGMISAKGLRLYRYMGIVEYALDIGDTERARRLLAVVEKAAPKLWSGAGSAQATYDLAARYAELGEFRKTWHLLMEAEKLLPNNAGEVKKDHTAMSRRDAMKDILTVCEAAGELEEALKHTGFDRHVVSALITIAERYLHNGDPNKITSIFKRIPLELVDQDEQWENSYERDDRLARALILCAHAGDMEKAKVLTASIDYEPDRGMALAGIAIAYHGTGDVDKARGLLEQASRYSVKYAAAGYAVIGDIDKGMTLAGGLKKGQPRAKALQTMAEECTRAGRTDCLMALARGYPHLLTSYQGTGEYAIRSVNLQKEKVSQAISIGLIKQGRFTLALDLAEEIETGGYAHYWILSEYFLHIFSERTEIVLDTLPRVVAMIERVQSEYSRHGLMCDTADLLLHVGKREEAERILDQIVAGAPNIKNPTSRAKSLAFVDIVRIMHRLDRGDVPERIRAITKKPFLGFRGL